MNLKLRILSKKHMMPNRLTATKSIKCPPELILLPEPIPFLGEILRIPLPDEIEDSPFQFVYGYFIVDWDEFV